MIGAVITLRSVDTDEVVEPLQADGAGGRRGRRAFLVVIDWLFPLLAVFMFGVVWLLHSLTA